jgi:hypothetical protein
MNRHQLTKEKTEKHAAAIRHARDDAGARRITEAPADYEKKALKRCQSAASLRGSRAWSASMAS